MSFIEQFIVEHLAGNRICLQTLDAQGFYENLGYAKCTPVQFTKFKKNKSDIFMKMQQLSQKTNMGNETVVKVNGEDRFWYDKSICL